MAMLLQRTGKDWTAPGGFPWTLRGLMLKKKNKELRQKQNEM